MYTRCPSCRSEITFEPPANMDSLPEGYKHRIKCPCCGVTIGVKLNMPAEDTVATFQPANPFATNNEPVYNAGNAEVYNPESKEEKKAAKKDKAKRLGTVRNIFMFIFSALLIAVNALAYVGIEIPYTDGFAKFNGIAVFANAINDFEAFKALFTMDKIVEDIFMLLPAVLFVFAGISCLVSLLTLKYKRAYHLIWSLLMLGAAVVIFLIPVIQGVKPFLDYIMLDVLALDGNATPQYGLFIVVGIAFLEFLFSLFFLAKFKKKKAKAE